MSADLSVRSGNAAPLRLADSLLRSLGGCCLKLCVTGAGSGSDAEQIGLATGSPQEVELAPAVMRRTRATMTEGEPGRCEVLVSASSVQGKVSELKLDSADALFAMVTGVDLGGRAYLLENASSTEAFGRVYLYRLLLRDAMPEAL